MKRVDSVRQRILRAIEQDGPMSVDELVGKLRLKRRQVTSGLSSLLVSGAVAVTREGGLVRYRLPERRGYEPPPEGRIDIAGPVYARGYRWGAWPV